MDADVFSRYEETTQKAYEVFNRIKPYLERYKSKFITKDRINSIDDYYNNCFELTYIAVMNYSEGSNSHSYKISIDDYVLNYILKKLSM